MTKLRIITTIAATIAMAGFAPSAYAFHSGGVGECEGCHTMHNSVGNAVVTKGEPPVPAGLPNLYEAGKFLLKGSDQSSACLNCHNQPDAAPSSYHISTDESVIGATGGSVTNPTIAPVEMTPGGDFAWLKTTFTFTVRGTPETDEGQGHGHSINAVDYNYGPDTNLTYAPGNGAGIGYPAANLHCSSCHDPHGKYRRTADGAASVKSGALIYTSGSYGALPKNGWAVGVYRLLGGNGYTPKSVGSEYAFTKDAPFAVVASSYNRAEADSAGVVTQTHVAYGAGMSEWCQNCHAAMHNDTYTSGVAGQVHPAGNGAKLTQAIVDNYNSWVSSGITGTQGYSSLAPFEEGDTLSANLKPHAVNTKTPGTDIQATTSNNVSCLSCHRAHASGFPENMRFFLENEFMTVANATTGAAEYDGTDGLNGTEGKIHFGKTVAVTKAAYYNRPASFFGPWARNYCNKCHAKD